MTFVLNPVLKLLPHEGVSHSAVTAVTARATPNINTIYSQVLAYFVTIFQPSARPWMSRRRRRRRRLEQANAATMTCCAEQGRRVFCRSFA
jgi:hypothetical protein